MNFQDFLKERREAITSASPTGLIVLLYDEAIQQLGLAIKAIKAGDIAARFNAVSLTANIVEHLHTGLDFAQGGEIAEQLGMVYRFVLSRLPRINLYNDSEIAAQMIGLLEPMRDAWHALERRRAEEAAEAETAPVAAVA
jgi:flagellar protein FliS